MITAEATAVAHCVADADHLIVSCDDSFAALLGRERAEIVGRHPLEFTHTLDRHLNATMLDRLAADGAAFSITKRYLRGDGSLLWVCNTVAPIGDGAGRKRISVTSRPIADPVGTSSLMRNVAAARRLCGVFVTGKRLFGADIISAPAPEIILRLYAAEIEGNCLTGEDLARALDLGSSQTNRWLKVLQQRELIEVERGEAVSSTATFRIAKRCELALDELMVAADA